MIKAKNMKKISFFFFILFSVPAIATLSAQEHSSPVLTVSGEVTNPLELHLADLQNMEKDTARLLDRSGKMHLYKGVPVIKILQHAGVTLGASLRGENLSKYLLVTAADGYQVLFSLAEVDTSFINRKIILAYEMDGKALPLETGPLRLVVPAEKLPARSCFEVVAFYVGWGRE